MTIKGYLPVGNPQSVAYSATSTSLFGANSAARYRSVFNNATVACYVLFNGVAASNALFTVKILAGGYFEFPNNYLYTNQVNIIWDAAGSGAALTMEY